MTTENHDIAYWNTINWMRIYVFKDAYAFDRENWTNYEGNVAIKPEMTNCADCATKV